MKPDLEMVQVRDDQSFKIWSHGYPFRTVRWHFHPEYELHLVTATQGNRYVGDHIGAFEVGDLVLVGPNLPHNWISDVRDGETVAERCLILQFTDEFITGCLALLPELRPLQGLLADSGRGVLFERRVTERVHPLMRELLTASGARRITLFMEVLEVLGRAERLSALSSAGFRPDPPAYRSTAINLALQHIGLNFTQDLNETALAKLTRQSPSAFSRSFRKHTGMTFVQYVNSLRIELACQHLSQADLSITDICYEVGFHNVSNFQPPVPRRQGHAALAFPKPPARRANARRGGVTIPSPNNPRQERP